MVEKLLLIYKYFYKLIKNIDNNMEYYLHLKDKSHKKDKKSKNHKNYKNYNKNYL